MHFKLLYVRPFKYVLNCIPCNYIINGKREGTVNVVSQKIYIQDKMLSKPSKVAFRSRFTSKHVRPRSLLVVEYRAQMRIQKPLSINYNNLHRV